jgi:FixJ family two-component response regulator
MGTTVVVIVSDPQERKRIEAALVPSGMKVAFVDDAATLLACSTSAEFACLIAAAEPDGGATLDLVREFRRRGVTLPVIVLGSHSAFRIAVDIARLDATDFLERPVSARELQRAVRRACGAER